jgi:capsid protein
MGVLDSLFKIFQGEKIPKKSAGFTSGKSNVLFNWSYDGEKNLGGIGPVVDYTLDYEALRSRSWKAYLDSEVAQTILGKFSLWVIGSGLKLQAEPNKRTLELNGISLKTENFNEDVEALFSVFSNSKNTDFSGMRNFNQIAKKTFLHSLVGGDMLVIMRFSAKKGCTIQLVDGGNVCSPFASAQYINEENGNIGNTIRNGIEIDKEGKHVAYYVKTGTLAYERVKCTDNSSGLSVAFLVYGLEYRIDNLRGLPLLSAVMQTIAQMDRYKEATLGAAEENAKIVYTIEHAASGFSTGEDPLIAEMRRARGDIQDDIPVDNDGNSIATKVAATTNKQTYNLPIGAQMKAHTSTKELHFKEFYNTNVNMVCATVGIPPNIAMSVYDGNYSASRAAIKEWEHTINVNRRDFYFQFYSKVYAFWLDIMILTNKVNAPGYIAARLSKNQYVLEAYRSARFIGSSVPHIDPLKEVEASRLKLGKLADSIPLSTVEQEVEALSTGDSDANIDQFAEELKMANKLGLKESQSL